MQPSEDREVLEGTVERITYYNPENGYSVIRLSPTGQVSMWGRVDHQGLVTVVGRMPEVLEGENLRVDGAWVTHNDYGRQFQATDVQVVPPTSIMGIKAYLASKAFKGVGERTAEKIVDHFGEETLDVLDHEPERLYDVEGVRARQIKDLISAWARQKEDKKVMVFLQGLGISTSYALRIIEAYGDRTVEKVQENPYQLARDIWGIGFKIADGIARNMGLPADHPRRLEAGLAYALDQATNDGHVYLPELELVDRAAELLDAFKPDVQAAVERAAKGDLIRLENLPSEGADPLRGVYLPTLYHSETGIARHISHMLNTPYTHLEKIQKKNVAVKVRFAAAESHVDLSDRQEAALRNALTHKISVLTGGPGTGKTTALQTLIRVLEQTGLSFALASPTGRAAKRLSEATGRAASTIHRMLGYSPTEGFLANEENPLTVDMVIVDEVSMLDTILANALFRAVDERSHILLVGDVDQLPSVGPGDVLRDLISSGLIPVTRLDVIFRQVADSLIVANAHRINQGEMPIFAENAEDFFLFNIPDDPARAADLVVDVVVNRIPERFGFDPMQDVQVMVPMYRGAVGVEALNDRLQSTLNPKGERAQQVFGGRTFRVGDKVLQTRNNYEKEVFNGDIGTIAHYDFSSRTMTVRFDERDIDYDWGDVHELTHAYAISVHRAQGSEYPAVVMPIVSQHYLLLQRNLLYTAITRARRLAVLVGSKKAVAIAVKNDSVSSRYTTLAARLRGEL